MSVLGNFLKQNFQCYKDIAIKNADSLQILKEFPKTSIDCIITDPPYFIDGMGNNWNVLKLEKSSKKGKVISNLPIGMKFDIEQGYKFQEFENKLSKHLYKILKPGGFYLSFSQPRLYHRMTVAIEDCGFEIRDMIVWKRCGQAKAFSQDHFIKKLKVSDKKKQKLLKLFEYKKTPQLMGLHEDICVAQKPKDGTFIENYIKYKVGLINTKFNSFPSNLLAIEKYEKSEHLTSKPIKLIEQLIILHPVVLAIIFDS